MSLEMLAAMKAALSRLMSGKSALPGDGPISYEESKELAQHHDAGVRRVLAQRQDIRSEILYFLAGDPDSDVRRTIAANSATPVQANRLLAQDEDPEVRGILAEKIARLAPGLSDDERDRLQRMTYETLLLLAHDQITRVRQILAETLKDVANAPPTLIKTLAHDSELTVCVPVLESSPMLSDEDLLEIIQGSPVQGSLSAISRRNALCANIADAIAHSDDVDAIAMLLANRSAQIREETLDMLLDRAPANEQWHGPLVSRPHLSPRAASRLARFVAEQLLQVLQDRADLPLETRQAVAETVRLRVGQGGVLFAEPRRSFETEPEVQWDALMETARRLYDEGSLTETAILTAAHRDNANLAACALALRSGLPLRLVQKVIATQSTKGMLAISWKSGLSVNAAVNLQTTLGKVSPNDAIRPRPGSTAYPLSAEEMVWQIEFFSAMAGDVVPDSSFTRQP